MKDKRVASLRSVLSSIIESLESLVRIARWKEAEPVPEPLAASARELEKRLHVAKMLVGDAFVGPPAVVEVLLAMSGAVRGLEAAYAAYREQVAKGPGGAEEAANALDAEIGAISAGSERWA